jgi:hypothetical protein
MLGKTTGLCIAALLLAGSPAFAEECAASGPLPDGAVFVGYSRTDESALHAAALLRDAVLEKYDGKHLTVGLNLQQGATTSSTRTRIKTVSPYLERLGPDHCEYPAELSARKSHAWRIWSSGPIESLRQPTEAEHRSFRSLRPDCVHQGDPPPGEIDCTLPELFAVSDIDADGKPEYWHSTPYRWDTGLSISELVDSANLEVIVAACPGCSD